MSSIPMSKKSSLRPKSVGQTDTVEALRDQTKKMDEQLQQLRARVAADKSKWETSTQKNDGVYWNASKSTSRPHITTAAPVAAPTTMKTGVVPASSSKNISNMMTQSGAARRPVGSQNSSKPIAPAKPAQEDAFDGLMVTGGAFGVQASNHWENNTEMSGSHHQQQPVISSRIRQQSGKKVHDPASSPGSGILKATAIKAPPRPGSAIRSTTISSGAPHLNIANLAAQVNSLDSDNAPGSLITSLQRVVIAPPKSARSKADVSEALAIASKNAAASAMITQGSLTTSQKRPSSASRAPKPLVEHSTETTRTFRNSISNRSVVTSSTTTKQLTVEMSTDVSDGRGNTPGSLLHGNFDEAANAREFQEARKLWLMGQQSSTVTQREQSTNSMSTSTSTSTSNEAIVKTSLLGPSVWEGEYDEEANANAFAAARIAWLRESDPEAAKRVEEEEAAKKQRNAKKFKEPAKKSNNAPREGEPGYLLFGTYNEAENAREFQSARDEFLKTGKEQNIQNNSVIDDDAVEPQPPGTLLQGPEFDENSSKASFAEARQQWLESFNSTGQSYDLKPKPAASRRESENLSKVKIASIYAAERAGIISPPILDPSTSQAALSKRSQDLWDSLASKLDLGSLIPNADSRMVGPDPETEKAGVSNTKDHINDELGLKSAKGIGSVTEGPISVQSLLLSRPISAHIENVKRDGSKMIGEKTSHSTVMSGQATVNVACYNCYKLTKPDSIVRESETQKVFCGNECLDQFKESILKRRNEAQAELERVRSALEDLKARAKAKADAELDTKQDAQSEESTLLDENNKSYGAISEQAEQSRKASEGIFMEKVNGSLAPHTIANSAPLVVKAIDPTSISPVVELPDDDFDD